MKLRLLAGALLLAATVAGCGGGGSSTHGPTSPVTSNNGTAQFNIQWPEPPTPSTRLNPRLIPQATQSILITATVHSSRVFVGSVIIPRASRTGSIAHLPVNSPVDFKIEAKPNADGTGVDVAMGATQLTPLPAQTVSPSGPITLSSTVASLTIIGAAELGISQTWPYVVQALDVTSEIVLLGPTTVKWSVASGGSGILSINTTSGSATGLAAGDTSINAVYSEGTVSNGVTVSANLPVGVAVMNSSATQYTLQPSSPFETAREFSNISSLSATGTGSGTSLIVCDGPSQVTIDSDNNPVFANSVRMLNPDSGSTATTVIGTASYSYTVDAGFSVQDIFVEDPNPDGGTGLAKLGTPISAAITQDGQNVAISDSDGVRSESANLLFDVNTGTGNAFIEYNPSHSESDLSLPGARAMAYDFAGNLYFIDTNGDVQINQSGSNGSFTAISGVNAVGIAVDHDHNLILADSAGVQRYLTDGSFNYTLDTNFGTNGTITLLDNPSGVAVDPTGGATSNIFVTYAAANRIVQFDSSGVYLNDLQQSVYTTPGPIAVNGSGEVYVGFNGGGVRSGIGYFTPNSAPGVHVHRK